MKEYQRDFIAFLIENKVLSFGEFTLKSGRVSPYFFNCGNLSSGSSMKKLGEFYAKALVDAKVEYSVLFGPAYKGIPLVTATAIALSSKDQEAPFAFNRKETKDHGEGGNIVGASLKNERIFVVDDVITAGTAIRESVTIINASAGTFSGVIVALDRQEKGPKGDSSAIEAVKKEFGVPVVSIVALEHVLEYLKTDEEFSQYLPLMVAYREKYGAK